METATQSSGIRGLSGDPGSDMGSIQESLTTELASGNAPGPRYYETGIVLKLCSLGTLQARSRRVPQSLQSFIWWLAAFRPWFSA